jgi:hypothetical protein
MPQNPRLGEAYVAFPPLDSNPAVADGRGSLLERKARGNACAAKSLAGAVLCPLQLDPLLHLPFNLIDSPGRNRESLVKDLPDILS